MANNRVVKLSSEWRERIEKAGLLERVLSFAMGEVDKDGNLVVEMTMPQLRAAEIVLRKCLPDLKAIEMAVEVHDNRTRAQIDHDVFSLVDDDSADTSKPTAH